MKQKCLLVLSLVLISTRLYATDHHKAENDITVLKNEFKTRIVPGKQDHPWRNSGVTSVDIGKCQVLAEEDNQGYDSQFYDEYKELKVDCKSAIEELFGLPLITHAKFDRVYKMTYSTEDGEQRSRYQSEGFNCRVMEITTATREEALHDSTGIGFYTSNIYSYKDEMLYNFVPSNKLKKTNRARSHSGDSLVLHKFLAIAYCWIGTMSSSTKQSFQFKPFLKYESGDDTYYNWDRAQENYYISQRSENFNREHEVVVPGSVVD